MSRLGALRLLRAETYRPIIGYSPRRQEYLLYVGEPTNISRVKLSEVSREQDRPSSPPYAYPLCLDYCGDNDADDDWIWDHEDPPESDSDYDSLDDSDYDPQFDPLKKPSMCKKVEDQQELEKDMEGGTHEFCRVNIVAIKFEQHKEAGIGVILSRHDGSPIVAAAEVAQLGPMVFHELQGVKLGFELAKHYGCHRVELCCDYKVACFVGNTFLFDQGDRLAEELLTLLAPRNARLLRLVKEIYKIKFDFKYFGIKLVPTMFSGAAMFLASFRLPAFFCPKTFPPELQSLALQDVQSGFYLHFGSDDTFEHAFENCRRRENSVSSPLSCVKKGDEEMYFVHVDGYYKKGETGKYGVIVCDSYGKPIVAATGVSKPVTGLYHQMLGVKRGLELAKKYGITRVKVCCNCRYTINVAVRKFCPHIGGVDKDICPSFSSIHKGIQKLRSTFVDCYFRTVDIDFNRAADYLAKKVDKTIVEMLPEEFPWRLQQIVCEDVSWFVC